MKIAILFAIVTGCAGGLDIPEVGETTQEINPNCSIGWTDGSGFHNLYWNTGASAIGAVHFNSPPGSCSGHDPACPFPHAGSNALGGTIGNPPTEIKSKAEQYNPANYALNSECWLGCIANAGCGSCAGFYAGQWYELLWGEGSCRS